MENNIAVGSLSDVQFIDVDMGSYLAKHEIVYRSPAREGWEGFPVGNGSYGGMYWSEPEGVVFQANHTDSLELPDPEGKNEGWAVLRSCGRLRVKHPFPIHDWLYVNDYEARLSLHRAEVDTSVKGAFGTFTSSFYVHADHPVAVLQYQADYSGPLAENGAPVRVELERWGSRVFGWWYNSQQGGASMDIGDVSVSVEGDDLCLLAAFRGVDVALRCRVLGSDGAPRVLHNRMGEIEIPASPHQEFTVLLACVLSTEDTDPLAAAGLSLDAVAKGGAGSSIGETHRRWWDAYWRRSFISVPFDYAENLYYLQMYLMGSSCRGKYPPYFNGGIWLWNRDVRNWVNPHHWNQQQSFWCLPAANRSDFLFSYMNTYLDLMPEALRVTKDCGYQGLRWSEQHDFAGRHMGLQSASFKDNHTPAAHIALFYWWYYRFTGDADYFRQRGLPFLEAVGDFYLDFIKWNEERKEYEIPLASTYEDERPWRFTNTITMLSMAKRILTILADLELEDEEKQKRCRRMLDHLPGYMINDRDAVRGPTLASGLVDGKELPEKETHNHGPLFCPILPAGDIGLAQRGSELFTAACNTMATYPAGVLAITPTAAVAARLGMAELAHQKLRGMIRHLQQFANGMFFNIDHWNMYSRRTDIDLHKKGGAEYWVSRDYMLDDSAKYQRDYLEDRGCRLENIRVRPYGPDGVDEHVADTPMDPFSQMGMESLGNFTAGLQEMLLQSHEGAVRVFPAVPDGWGGAFVLAAEGGFLVSSRKAPFRQPEYIEVKSELGEKCTVILPWTGDVAVTGLDGGTDIEYGVLGPDRTVSFPTAASGLYLIRPATAETPEKLQFTGIRNDAPKKFLEATLGKESEW